MARVTVVVPLYNKERFIKQTLASVLRQSMKDFNVVVINDGSTDRSPDVVEQLESPKIKLLHQPNKGVESARNYGLSVSDSEFVVFLDADDLMYENRLARQLEHLSGDPTKVLVASWVRFINENGRIIRRFISPLNNNNLQYKLNFTNPFINSSVTIRRSAVDSVGGFRITESSRFSEDFDLWLRLSELGGLGAIPAFLTAYRVLPESRSQSDEPPLQVSADSLALSRVASKVRLSNESHARELIAVLNSRVESRHSKVPYTVLARQLLEIQIQLRIQLRPNYRYLFVHQIGLLLRIVTFRLLGVVMQDRRSR